MKIYTKTGDQGLTALLSGTRVSKNHPRIEAYGCIDELNSSIGLLLCTDSKSTPLFKEQLLLMHKCQHYLFNIGSHLACDDSTFTASLPPINSELLSALEANIDLMTEQCSPLKDFILPGGSLLAAQVHIARCICRRAERLTCLIEPLDKNIIPFLNRLSDYLFCFARFANQVNNCTDVIWSKDPA